MQFFYHANIPTKKHYKSNFKVDELNFDQWLLDQLMYGNINCYQGIFFLNDDRYELKFTIQDSKDEEDSEDEEN